MSSENPIVHIDFEKKQIYYDKYAPMKGGKKFFDRQIDLFLFAAAYGYIINRPIDLTQGSTESPFRWSNFNEYDITLVKAISLAYIKNPEIILDKEHMMQIVEKFAQGGIDELISRIEQPGEKEMNILEILSEATIEKKKD